MACRQLIETPHVRRYVKYGIGTNKTFDVHLTVHIIITSLTVTSSQPITFRVMTGDIQVYHADLSYKTQKINFPLPLLCLSGSHGLSGLRIVIDSLASKALEPTINYQYDYINVVDIPGWAGSKWDAEFREMYCGTQRRARTV